MYPKHFTCSQQAPRCRHPSRRRRLHGRHRHRRRRHASAWAARLLLPPRAPTSCPAMCPASAPNNSNSGHNRRAERAQAVAVECMAPEWPEPTSDFAPHTARALSQDTAATGLQAQASAARTEVQHMSTRRAGGRAAPRRQPVRRRRRPHVHGMARRATAAAAGASVMRRARR